MQKRESSTFVRGVIIGTPNSIIQPDIGQLPELADTRESSSSDRSEDARQRDGERCGYGGSYWSMEETRYGGRPERASGRLCRVERFPEGFGRALLLTAPCRLG